VDNGDGTVTDHQTGLQWEQQVASSSCGFRCVDQSYSLSGAFLDFLPAMNNCQSLDGITIFDAGVGGHCDWRLPTISELQTIFDFNRFGCGRMPGLACIDPVFGQAAQGPYWTTTSYRTGEWAVSFSGFNNPLILMTDRATLLAVRAVRTTNACGVSD
jgi:hypothetical protein